MHADRFRFWEQEILRYVQLKTYLEGEAVRC